MTEIRTLIAEIEKTAHFDTLKVRVGEELASKIIELMSKAADLESYATDMQQSLDNF